MLVVDCCSLVHAKALRHLPHAPLQLLDDLAVEGARFATTTAIYGELTASSLRMTLGEWDAQEWLQQFNATSRERREVRNKLRRSDRIPGKNDMGLIAIARRLKVPILTHDGPAQKLALRCGLVVVDLLDVAAWAAWVGIITIDEISIAWGGLSGYTWPDSKVGWLGSLDKSLADRPALDVALAELTKHSATVAE